MKNKYGILTVLAIVFSIVMSFSVIVSADVNYTDLDRSSKYYDSVQKLSNSGCLIGYPDGSFRVNNSITRAELVKMINIFFGYNNPTGPNPFWDVHAGEWHYGQVLTSVRQGYIEGYLDSSFHPDAKITREEVCAIIFRNVSMANLPLNVQIADTVSPWAANYVKQVVASDLWSLESGNYFRATHNATRGEVCLMLAKITENKSMNRAISRINTYVLPKCNSAQREVANDIVLSMQKYIVNPNYDYKGAAEVTKVKYGQLSAEDRKGLKTLISSWVNINDLIALQEYFFPNMNFQ